MRERKKNEKEKGKKKKEEKPEREKERKRKYFLNEKEERNLIKYIYFFLVLNCTSLYRCAL